MPLGRTYRLVLLGASGVGKTALIEHLIFGNHVVGMSGAETSGDIYEASLETERPTRERVQIFDTPGNLFTLELSELLSFNQEHYLSLADGFVLVYDITNKSSFDLVVNLKNRISLRHRECPIVIIGNKYDLDGIRDIAIAHTTQWAKSNGVIIYETSVLDRDSLREPFTYIAWCMANPGHLLPIHFQSSPFNNTQTRKSFTIPQTRKPSHRHSQIPNESHTPLVATDTASATPLPSPTQKPTSLPIVISIPSDTNNPKSLSVTPTPTATPTNAIDGSSQFTLKSSPSDNCSEFSMETRISSKLYPDDATFPHGKFLGLCMSNRTKEKS